MIVWANGAFHPFGPLIEPDDRGFLLGDGAFETILVEGGVPAFLAAHLRRLKRGLSVLGIEAALHEGEFYRIIKELALRNNICGRAACRITASRAGGPRGLAPPAGQSATTRLLATLASSPAGAPADAPVTLIVSPRRRLSKASTVSFKCVGAYAENMLAKSDALAAGVDDAVMLNEYGRVACASAANVFAVRDGLILFPAESEGATPGIVRGAIKEEIRNLGLAHEESALDPEILRSSSLFITNSLIGVRCAAMADGSVDSAADHRLIDELSRAYERRMSADLAIAAEGGG